jgi:hypothetical protein
MSRGNRLPLLIDLPEPCSVGWESMDGDERVRFCKQCSKHVHDLSALTLEEIEALSEGETVCVSFEFEADGRIRTAEDRQRRRRPLGMGVSALSLVALTGALAACDAADTSQRPEALPSIAVSAAAASATTAAPAASEACDVSVPEALPVAAEPVRRDRPTRTAGKMIMRPRPTEKKGAEPAQCSPPYYLDTNGVKKYKRECL